VVADHQGGRHQGAVIPFTRLIHGGDIVAEAGTNERNL
jgi:hypothetical protein